MLAPAERSISTLTLNNSILDRTREPKVFIALTAQEIGGRGLVKAILEHPRVIPCAIYAPGRAVSQLVIVGKNVPGVLAKIAARIAENGINILSGLVTAEPGEDTGMLTLFLDFTNATCGPEELAEELRAMDVVLEAGVVARRFGDIAIDGTTHTTMFLGERVVMLSVDDLGAMFDWLDRNLQTGGHVLLFEMGKAASRADVRELRETYGLEGRDLLEAFLALRIAAGWFSYEVVEYDEEAMRFVVRLYGSFECAFFAGRGRSMGHLVRGILAGAFGEVYGREFRVREVKCVAKGDECCEFVVELAK